MQKCFTIHKCIEYNTLMKLNVDKIWIFIKENCKTQTSFANLCGVHRKTISRALNSRQCSLNVLIRMAVVMGVFVDDLFVEE